MQIQKVTEATFKNVFANNNDFAKKYTEPT